MSTYIHEVYFGKTKSIQAIENQLDKFRQKYMGQYLRPGLSSDPDILKFNRMMEDEFGFGCFALTIVSENLVNAFTLPVDKRFDVNANEKSIIATKTGFKFNKKLDYCCMTTIYTGILLNPAYTTEEVLAIILHEVGHNFNSALNQRNAITTNMYKALLFVDIILMTILHPLKMLASADILMYLSNTVTSIIKKADQDLRAKNNLLINIIDMIKYIKGLIEVARVGMNKARHLMTFNISLLIGGLLYAAYEAIQPLTWILLPHQYRNERTADNFPTMYGYGPALSSALRKLEDDKCSPEIIEQSVSHIPVVAGLLNLVTLPVEIIQCAMDEHPQHIARAKDQLNMLERESQKSDLDPKMKKYIQADIKAINKEMENYIDIRHAFTDPQIGRHIYYRVLYHFTGSNAIKDMILDDKKKYYEYDRVYYDRLESKR